MTLKVLSVDDSKTIRMIVKKAFKPFDCEIFEAENGVEGLAAAAKGKPDLIVLDITMPVMTGVEMLEKLRSEPDLKDIPVIMLTAESSKDNVMQIVRMGVRDYIVKPFKGEQLVERAEKIITLEPKKTHVVAEDASKKYFTLDGDVQIMTLRGKVSTPVVAQIEAFLPEKLKSIFKSGYNKMVLDLTKEEEANMTLFKLVNLVAQSCQKTNIYLRLAGTPSLGEGLKGFAETSEITVYPSVYEAKGAF